MLPILASLLILQANTAAPIFDTPLEPGRWVIRKTEERGTGLGGISASLASNDERYRLVVRCDYSYASSISQQFIPIKTDTPRPVTGTRLLRIGEGRVPVEWEAAGPGVFARDGDPEEDNSASLAALDLQHRPGQFRVTSKSPSGATIRAEFDSRDGRDAIRQVRSACRGG